MINMYFYQFENLKYRQTLKKIWSYYPIPYEDFQGIALSFVLWTSLYMIVANLPLMLKPAHVNLEKIDDLDVRNRMVSIVHGLGIMYPHLLGALCC